MAPFRSSGESSVGAPANHFHGEANHSGAGVSACPLRGVTVLRSCAFRAPGAAARGASRRTTTNRKPCAPSSHFPALTSGVPGRPLSEGEAGVPPIIAAPAAALGSAAHRAQLITQNGSEFVIFLLKRFFQSIAQLRFRTDGKLGNERFLHPFEKSNFA